MIDTILMIWQLYQKPRTNLESAFHPYPKHHYNICKKISRVLSFVTIVVVKCNPVPNAFILHHR